MSVAAFADRFPQELFQQCGKRPAQFRMISHHLTQWAALSLNHQVTFLVLPHLCHRPQFAQQLHGKGDSLLWILRRRVGRGDAPTHLFQQAPGIVGLLFGDRT
jgi:hypothetical protein